MIKADFKKRYNKVLIMKWIQCNKKSRVREIV